MSNISIGITAMELFAYNPFRILGIPVNSSHAEIDSAYKKLNQMCNSGEIANYTTEYDFDSLPPFSRSAQTLKTAYAKLASNGYRCFAYADSSFLVSLSIDDIVLNIRDISCYDCFLRCYMWLIINDREMQEHDLWIQLAKYIDKLIISKPEEWTKYFDNRFPDEMLDDNMAMYRSFYSTFCEIILLPLKEMVRGSMKCNSAIEILKCAKINVDEKFDSIDIPQANAPKNGESAPKLKIALKYGDEYFDISTGSMKSYSTDTVAKESNSFMAATNAPLDAAILMDDNGSESEKVSKAASTEPASTRTRPERNAAVTEKKTTLRPTETVAPKPEPLKLNKESASPIQVQNVAPFQQTSSESSDQADAEYSEIEKPKRSFRGNSTMQTEDVQTTSAPEDVDDFNKSNPFFNIDQNKTKSPKDTKMTRKPTSGFEKLAEEAKKEAEAEIASYTDEETEQDYTDALVELLRANQTRAETMRSVDTKKKLTGAEMAGPSHTKAKMDAIDMDTYKEENLYGGGFNKKFGGRDKFTNIDDLMGTSSYGKNYGLSAVDEYKREKKKQKESLRSLFVAIGIVAACLLVFVVLYFMGMF